MTSNIHMSFPAYNIYNDVIAFFRSNNPSASWRHFFEGYMPDKYGGIAAMFVA